MTEVWDPVKAEALERLAAALDAVALAGVSPHDAAEARALIAGLEVQARRLRSVQVDLVDEIDRTGAHRFDGHASAKVMVRHVAKLSNAEAARRAQSARALRDLPTVRTAFRAGRIGGCQVAEVGAEVGAVVGVPTPATGDPPAGSTTDTKNTATPPTATKPEPGTSPAPTAPQSTERSPSPAPTWRPVSRSRPRRDHDLLLVAPLRVVARMSVAVGPSRIHGSDPAGPPEPPHHRPFLTASPRPQSRAGRSGAER